MRRSRILFALLLSAAACGGSHKPDPTTDPKLTNTGSGSGSASASSETSGDIPADLVAKTDRAVSYVDALATAAEKNTPDCAKMATAMTAVVNGPDGTAITDVDGDPRFKQYSKQIEAKYGDKTNELSDRLSKALMPCQGNQDIEAVIEKSGLGGPPGGGGDGDGDTDEAPPASNE